MTDDEICNTVATVAMPPGWKLTVEGVGPDGYDVCMLPTDPSRTTLDSTNLDRKFPTGLCAVHFPRPKTRTQVARDCLAAYVISEFHEGLEFVRLDGRRLAHPHPDPHEDEHWTWLTDRIGRVVRDYARTFPTTERTRT